MLQLSFTSSLNGFYFQMDGDQDIPLNWELGRGRIACKSESLNFPLLLDKNMTYWEIPHIGKKGISNSF